jgi:hypothetical protein
MLENSDSAPVGLWGGDRQVKSFKLEESEKWLGIWHTEGLRSTAYRPARRDNVDLIDSDKQAGSHQTIADADTGVYEKTGTATLLQVICVCSYCCDQFAEGLLPRVQ